MNDGKYQNYYSNQFLETIRLVDITGRTINDRERVDVRCLCGCVASARFGDIKRNYIKYSKLFVCKTCRYDKKIKHYSKQILESLGVKDTTPRVIASKSKVEAVCQGCGQINDVEFNSIKRKYETSKRGYHCKKCGSKYRDYHKALLKRIETVTDLYNTRFITQCPKIIEQIKATNLSRYGVDNVSKLPEIRLKAANTMLKKYGVKNPMHSKELRNRWIKSVPTTNKSSEGELELKKWLEETFPHLYIKKSYCDDGQIHEIDILVKDSRGINIIAIEYNGEYYHSEKMGKDRHYHLNKTRVVSDQKKCQLIHIFELEWYNKKEVVKSYISSKLEKGISVRASKCEIKELDWNTAKEFCDNNHLQGKPNSSILNLGLYYKDDLLSVMTFSKPHRQNMSAEPHLSRYAIKPGYRIHGGLSKMSKYAYNKLGEFVTFVHLRLSSGDSYEKAGYIKLKELPPDYWYWDKKKHQYLSKQSRRKSEVRTPKGMTEKEHAELDGLYRIWDCGKVKYLYTQKLDVL